MKADIIFKRTGTINKNGSVPGFLTIGTKTWPTIEKGANFTFVRKGKYKLLMCHKQRGIKKRCLCFNEDRAISSHLIHYAENDNHRTLEGCIAPGLTSNAEGIKKSKEAMEEIWQALNGFKEWHTIKIIVENNIIGAFVDEEKEQWIKRRIKLGKRAR